jgi:hypothetical protein
MPEQPRYALLELAHSRVLGVHVISDWGGQHRLPHLFGWLGHRVRAQINHGQESDELGDRYLSRVPAPLECAPIAYRFAVSSGSHGNT